MKNKTETIFACQECGATSSKWVGKCVTCSTWNSFKEEEKSPHLKKSFRTIQKPVKLSLEDAFLKRLPTGIQELDRVLNGGIVHDSFLLLSGEPGIGKSTLALQIALALSTSHQILYCSGEESVSQISSRAKRILGNTPFPTSLLVQNEDHLESLLTTLYELKPKLAIIDSAQTIVSEELSGSSGSISQTRFLAESLMRVAKEQGIAVLLIGHVNKEGDIAGPKVLEHLVDIVLNFEGDQYQDVRLLRCQKNRFGATSEIGVFSLQEKGLEEVKNPSELFLQGRKRDAMGSAISVTMEGSRPFVLEVQGLTVKADFTYPKRTSSGFDLSRLQLLIAVLSKHLKLKLDQQDVYCNITGGFRARDPALDTALAAALLSSSYEKPIPEQVAILGEIGLSGEIRPVMKEAMRLKELEKLGFQEVWGAITASSSILKMRKITDVKSLNAFFTTR